MFLEIRYDTFGPTMRLPVKWDQTFLSVQLQTYFADNIFPNGSFLVPTAEQRIAHTFKYNYFTGKYASFATETKYSTYFKQSVLFHSLNDFPQMLSVAEVLNLV